MWIIEIEAVNEFEERALKIRFTVPELKDIDAKSKRIVTELGKDFNKIVLRCITESKQGLM